MGSKEAGLAEMEAICTARGAMVCGTGSVGWWSLHRRRQVTATIDRLRALF